MENWKTTDQIEYSDKQAVKNVQQLLKKRDDENPKNIQYYPGCRAKLLTWASRNISFHSSKLETEYDGTKLKNLISYFSRP